MAIIKADVPYRTAIAERGKFWELDDAYLASLGYPASGEGKYAILTYSVNSTSTSGSSGTGTIVDGVDPSIIATVADLNNANPLTTMIVDASGDQITSFGASLIGQDSLPIPVVDGTTVDLLVDTYGRQIIFGSNLSLNALDVNVINDPTINRLGPVLNLDAVTATGAGVSVDVSLYHNFTIQIIASAVTTGLTIDVEHSLDGTNWATISTNAISVDGVLEVSMSQQAYKYLRTNIISRTDGTITAYIYAGN